MKKSEIALAAAKMIANGSCGYICHALDAVARQQARCEININEQVATIKADLITQIGPTFFNPEQPRNYTNYIAAQIKLANRKPFDDELEALNSYEGIAFINFMRAKRLEFMASQYKKQEAKRNKKH